MDTPPAASRLHARVLDELGVAICGGGFPPGTVLYVDELVERCGVSRSVVREVLRVLASMGLVEARRRVGTRIRPAADWNVFDPQVIRWRLASDERLAQLRSLTELRAAVEPQAALLAARRASADDAAELVALAAKLWAAAESGDEPGFLHADIEFHRRVLLHSGNEMFAGLHELVAESLTGRHHHHLMPQHPDRRALTLHADVAQAIQRRDGERARTAMTALTQQIQDELPACPQPEGRAPSPRSAL
ncbi:FCD domain-containing protein [Catellatospora citrea]|uniref:FadR/GntR family transcriptional regulator n=1 Tax=Catellatospora citrea TaxID=53366 RepID=UPI00340767AC